jgi:glucan phosphoethanolaminetransferase (alkaline phosphatase superfamily)
LNIPLDLNKQIMDITNQSYSNYQQDIQKSRIQEETLQKNYQILLDERIQIEQMMREFETLNSANENGQINVTSNYYKYIIFLFIALFLVFILIRYSSDITQRGGGKYIYNKAIWLFMIIFIAIMILNYKTILAK